MQVESQINIIEQRIQVLVKRGHTCTRIRFKKIDRNIQTSTKYAEHTSAMSEQTQQLFIYF